MKIEYPNQVVVSAKSGSSKNNSVCPIGQATRWLLSRPVLQNELSYSLPLDTGCTTAPIDIIPKLAMVSNWCHSIVMKEDKEIRFTLRLPVGLHVQIRRVAKEKHRSINSQIVHILAQCMKTELKGKGNG